MIGKLLRFLGYALVAIFAIRRKRSAIVPTPEPEPRREGAKASGSRMKRWITTGLILIAILAVGSFLVVLSGAVPIKASSRHWAITSWFLNFTKERSVSTHTLGKETPDLDSRMLVLKGATHYETGCSPCHGSPRMNQPRIPHGMTPPPPPLGNIISKFDENELFYIVKHGIKFTGMPAWAAANRDDEIWAMVAFLRELPMIDAGKYQHLAFGEQGEGESGTVEDLNLPERTTRILTESCSRCHGRDGLGRGLGESPKLAGQKPAYLLGSLQAYAAGRRSSGIMGPLANALGEEQMKQLADHYSSLPTTREIPINLDEKAIERGRIIATSGIPAQRVPACVECHGPSTAPRNEMYPRLESQYAEYLVLQLELFKGKQRGGTAYSHLMHFVAGGLTPEQMSDVAQYFASLDPAPAHERAAR